MRLLRELGFEVVPKGAGPMPEPRKGLDLEPAVVGPAGRSDDLAPPQRARAATPAHAARARQRPRSTAPRRTDAGQRPALLATAHGPATNAPARFRPAVSSLGAAAYRLIRIVVGSLVSLSTTEA